MKLKRILSAVAGAAVSVNFLAGLPLAAFAAGTTEYTFTYDNYEVLYSVTNSWDQSEQLSFTITNTGDTAIENWMLVCEGMEAGIGDIWNAAVVETDDGQFYVRNAGYNAVIEPDSSVSFGCVVTGADAVPSDILMQQARVSKAGEDYDVSLNVTDDWGPSFNAEIILRNNTDKPLEWWELDFSTNFTISEIVSSWVASSIRTGDDSYRFKGTFNGIIPPQSAISLGFSGNKNAELDTPEIVTDDLTEVVFGGYPQHIDIAAERQAEREYVESLNTDPDHPVEFTNNSDGTVSSIDGKFSEVSVVDADSALEALDDIKYLIGAENPAAQLVLESVFESPLADYNTFYFKEVYGGVDVYERTVTVVARKSGEVLSMASNFADIAECSLAPAISVDAAKSAAGLANASLTIYTFDEYEDAPVLAYLCSNEEKIAIVSAQSGEVITEFETVTASSDDEAVPARDIYNYDQAPETSYDGSKLIYYFGEFGGVDNQSDVPALVLSDDEKDTLEVNSADIEFVFADDATSYMVQYVPGTIDDRTAYIAAHSNGDLRASAVEDISHNKQDAYGNWYVDVPVVIDTFEQVYQGYQVYGRAISMTMNDENRTAIMDSNVLPQSALENITVPASFIGSDAAVQEVADALSLSDAGSRIVQEANYLNNSNPVIYSWDTETASYSADPVFVYVILDTEAGKTYLVDAEDGDILLEEELGKGLTESKWGQERELTYFPVTFRADENDFIMSSVKPNGEYDNKVTCRQNSKPLVSANSFFYEPEGVNAYKIICKIYDYYENTFDHSGYDDNRHDRACEVGVNVKQHTWVGVAASSGLPYINYYPRNYSIASCANSDHTATHEFNHFLYREYNGYSTENRMCAAINEGYSNLFGQIMTEWASNGYRPEFNVDFESNSIKNFVDAGLTTGYGHVVGNYVVHGARLMIEKGLTNDEVGKLYNVSLTMGKYNYNSTLNSVRVNVFKAAKILEYDAAKTAIVKAAFDELWSMDNRQFFSHIIVRDYADASSVPAGTTVSLRRNLESAPLTAKQAGEFVYQIEPGNYYLLEVSAPGYVTYRDKVHMYYSEMNEYYVDLVAEQYDASNAVLNGLAEIKAIDMITNQPSGAIIRFTAYDENFRQYVVEDENGEPISVLADQTTGETGAFSFAPGYYFPYAVGADDYFIKQIMKIESGNTTVRQTYTYYDSDMNGDTQTYFSTIHIDEFFEEPSEFRAFNTMKVLSDAPFYDGRSGSTNFGRDMYLVFYEPETATDFNVVFRPTTAQKTQLEEILRSEGNLVIDSETGEKHLGHEVYQNGEWVIVEEPSGRSYYNIEVSARFGGNSGSDHKIITAFELYKGIIENDGAYILYTIHAAGDGMLTFD